MNLYLSKNMKDAFLWFLFAPSQIKSKKPKHSKHNAFKDVKLEYNIIAIVLQFTNQNVQSTFQDQTTKRKQRFILPA